MKKLGGILFIVPLVSVLVALADGHARGFAPPPPVATLIASASSRTTARLKKTWPHTTTPTRYLVLKGVRNFGKLNQSVWRSGQPTREGFQKLAAQGLKTVVNLQEEFPEDKDLLPRGIKYIYLPIKDNQAPTDKQAKTFLHIVSDPANWPVLVHCNNGEGRTGLMAAVVRHSLDGWDNEKILRELNDFRIKHLGVMRTPMPPRQKEFLRHWQKTPVLLSHK